MKAVVLSGGGSAGAYEIGVWKALRKLYYKYDIVCGTSVGAINACLMCEKSFHKAIKLWRNLDYNMIFDKSILNEENIMKEYSKNIITNGGMDISKLEYNLKRYINVDKIYNSKINYGLVTYNLSKKKACNLQKKDIPKNKFLDYVIASASCFPAFQKKEINSDKYIDGGVSDNLPINLAIKMGANEIIAVDLKKIGIKKRPNKKNINIKYIVPKSKTSNFLIFNKDNANNDINRGYNDTMKMFHHLDGNIYTFKKNNLNKFINKISYEYEQNLNKFITNKKIMNNILKSLFINSDNEIKDIITNAIDYLGKLYKIDDTKIYKINEFNNIVYSVFILSNGDKEILNKINLKKLLDTELSIYYMYKKIDDSVSNNNYDDLSSIILLFPKQFISALYLYIIK